MITSIPVCSWNVSTRRSSAGTRPKSSSAFGRSSTASRRTSCKRGHDELPQPRSRGAHVRVAPGVLELLQPEQDRGQRLPGLVVQLPRQPLALELLGADDAAQRIARHALGEVDCYRDPGREGLGQPQVLVGEARIAALLVVGREDADRPATQEERHEEAGPRAHRPPGFLVDLEVLDHRVDSLAATPIEHAAGLRAACRSSTVPTSSSAPSPATVRMTRSPPGAGIAITTSLAFTSSRKTRGDELEQLGQLDLRDERVDDLVQRLELGQPASRRFVQAGVLDGDGGLGRQHLRELLVLLGERPSAGLLRQVEVPVRHAAEEDWHSEEGLHRRMIGREPDRVGVLAEVVEPKGPRFR